MQYHRFSLFFLVLFCLWSASPVFAEPKDIIFWHSMAGQLGDEVNRLAEQFNASQAEYKVKPIYKGDYVETLTSFAAAFRAKHPPNLVQVAEVGTSVMRSNAGIVKPVEHLMHENGLDVSKDRYFPGVLQHYSADGVLLGMPFNVSIPVLFYNADLLASFGVSKESFPRTWDEFELLARRMHDAGLSCVYTTAYPAWILIESYQALQGLSSENSGSASWDNRQVGAHIKRMRGWQQQHFFEYGGRGDDATVLFTSGKCPIFSQSSGAYTGLSELVSFHVGVAPLPLDTRTSHIRHNNVVGGAAVWVVAGQSKDMERGIALYLAFLAQPTVQQIWHEHTGYLPLGNALLPSVANKQSLIFDIATLDLNHANELNQPAAQGAENQIRVIHDQMLEAIFSGMMSVDDAFNKANIRIQHVLKRFQKNTHTELS